MRQFTPEKRAYAQIHASKDDGVACISIHRPQAMNAYTAESLRELIHAFQEAAFDDEVAVIVLTGAGERAFCAGADVKEYAAEYVRRPRDYWKWMDLFRRYIESILRCGKPVIARINGACVAGGNETQLACDLAVMAEHAYVGQAGTRVGSVAAAGATQWLPLFVGDRRAREMLMLNRPIPAREALEWGLVNAVVPSVAKDGKFVENATGEQIEKAQRGEDGCAIDLSLLDKKVDAYASALKQSFPECMRYTKAQANALKESVWNATVGHAQEWLSIHLATPEPGLGMSAFASKKRPDYAGLRRKWAEDASPEYVWGPPAKSCACGATGLPEQFEFCGKCGAKL